MTWRRGEAGSTLIDRPKDAPVPDFTNGKERGIIMIHKGTSCSSGVGSSQPPGDLPSPTLSATSRTWPRSQPSISSSTSPKNHRVVTSAIQDRCSYTHYPRISITLSFKGNKEKLEEQRHSTERNIFRQWHNLNKKCCRDSILHGYTQSESDHYEGISLWRPAVMEPRKEQLIVWGGGGIGHTQTTWEQEDESVGGVSRQQGLCWDHLLSYSDEDSRSESVTTKKKQGASNKERDH